MTDVKLRLSHGRKRPVAGRDQILDAARALGVRDGWKAVTMRAVAQALHYTAPVIYEHFRDKEEVLTNLAIEAMASLERELAGQVPPEGEEALVLVDRYWAFMLENPQLYRLINGMDGVPIDRAALSLSARRICERLGAAVAPWLPPGGTGAEELVDEVWALLHGMAVLHMDRSVEFDEQRVKSGVIKLLKGAAR